MPELQVSGSGTGITLILLMFWLSTLLSPVNAVAGIFSSNKGYFWLAAFFSTPLALYAGLGGNTIVARLFLLTPLLLICARYAQSRGGSMVLVIAAFVFPAWVLIPIWFHDL